MVDLNEIVHLNVAPPVAELSQEMPGIHAHRHRAIRCIVHRQVAASLLEHQLGVELPHPHQGYLLPVHLDGGQGAVQAGELALLVGQGVARPVPGQPAGGDQLHRVGQSALILLHLLDGDDHFLFHGGPSIRCVIFWLRRRNGR